MSEVVPIITPPPPPKQRKRVCSGGKQQLMLGSLLRSTILSRMSLGAPPLSMLPAHSAAALHSRAPGLVLSGPTATGKSAFAVEIARRLGGEIVSADSVQLYKRLDIGSGKIAPGDTRGIPHHCIDVFDASDDVGANNAAGFCKLARSCIDGILARGAVPIIVGGSGMYLSFLLYGAPPTGPSPPAAQPFVSFNSRTDTAADLRSPSPPSSDECGNPSNPARSPHSNDAYRIKRRRDIESTSGCMPPYGSTLYSLFFVTLHAQILRPGCRSPSAASRLQLRVCQHVVRPSPKLQTHRPPRGADGSRRAFG